MFLNWVVFRARGVPPRARPLPLGTRLLSAGKAFTTFPQEVPSPIFNGISMFRPIRGTAVALDGLAGNRSGHQRARTTGASREDVAGRQRNDGDGRREHVAKEDRGFASMDRAKQREIASKGGKAAHQKGTAHEWTSEEARDAGRKGGLASHKRRREQLSSTGGSGEDGGMSADQNESIENRGSDASMRE